MYNFFICDDEYNISWTFKVNDFLIGYKWKQNTGFLWELYSKILWFKKCLSYFCFITRKFTFYIDEKNFETTILNEMD